MVPRHVRIAPPAVVLFTLLLASACAVPTAPEAMEEPETPSPEPALVEVGVVLEFVCLYEDPPEHTAEAEPTEVSESSEVFVRAPTTITGSQKPLIVVDDVVTDHSLADISRRAP